MVSMPARIASLMPAAPCACAATFRPHWCASSATARMSARDICCWPGSVLRENTPPVAQILITCAPYLRSVAHALACLFRTVGVERAFLLHRRREERRVAVPAGGAERICGGDHARAAHLALVDGLAQADVVERVRADIAHGGESGFQRVARRWARRASTRSGRRTAGRCSRRSVGSLSRCTCMSIMPGIKVMSPSAMRLIPAPPISTLLPGPTSTMRPLRTSTWPFRMMRPLRTSRMRSAVTNAY